MNTCKNCKWWGTYRDGECDKIDTTLVVEGSLNYFGIRASADDDSNLQTGFVTGPDFGCNQFDPKETL